MDLLPVNGVDGSTFMQELNRVRHFYENAKSLWQLEVRVAPRLDRRERRISPP